MSSPEPAPKQTRTDSARAMAPATAVSTDAASGASASAVAANGQAGDAATGRMMADDANHDGKWAAAWHGVADATQIIAEIVKLGLFNPFTGSYSGNLELGKALYYAQLFASSPALAAITLHGANRGSNPVHVDLNLYHKTFDLTASQLSIAGFHAGTASGRTADLNGLAVHAQDGIVTLNVASASLQDVTFARGAEHMHATDIGLHGLHASVAAGQSLEGALHFNEAHVHDLVYQDAAPVSFDLASGATLDAVWDHAAPSHAGPASPAPAGGATPSLDVLPPGASVKVDIGAVHARGAVGGQVSGGVDIDHITVSLAGKTGGPLAQILVTGFHGTGDTATNAAGVSLDQLKLVGTPGLIDGLLANQALAHDPNVRAAVQLVRSLGIRPQISGDVVFTHVGLAHGATGDQATSDFASDLVLPGVGKLGVTCTKMVVGTANGESGSFAHFAATLTSEAGKELGHVELDGGAAHNVSATTRTGEVHQFRARGDVAGIVRAGDALIQQLPITVRSGFAMVRSLGIKGDISGSLTAAGTKGGGTEISGNFTAHVAAGKVGSIAVDVADFRGSAATSADATFREFKTTLTNPRGHAVASIHIANGAFVDGAKGATAFKAGKLDATGESASVMAMVNAVVSESSTLSPPIKASFDLVRSYYVNGGGSLALTGVQVNAAANGDEAIKLQSANASFKLATGESVAAAVSGFDGDRAAKGSGVEFDSFTATLDSSVGGGHAKIVVEKGGAKLAPPPAKAGGAQDFSLHSHHATFDGEAANIAKLVAGLRAHLGTLPAPIASAFEVVGRYATSQTGSSQIAATVSGDNLSVTEAKGAMTSTGDVSARVAVPSGIANVSLHGFVGDGADVKFTGLDLSLMDPGGATAASLRVGATHLDKAGAVTVASINASGDGARLKQVTDALGNRVPAAVTQALAAIGPSRVDAAITSISVAPTADGGLVTDAAVIKVTGAISVSAQGSRYRSPNASLALYGAHVTLGPDKKPREIDATSMDVSGNFTSLGNGRAIDGDATIHVGASKIVLDAHGAVHEVQTSNVQLAGDVTAKTAPGSTVAPVVAPVSAGPAGADNTQSEAVTAAQAIKSADIQARTPIIPGRYGSGMVHVDVPAGATIYTSIQVRDYALTGGTYVHIQPRLEAYWIKAAGVDLETSGTQGVLEARLSGFFDQNITKYVVGQKKLQLDLGALVQEVMTNMHKSLDSAAQTAQKSQPAANTGKADKSAADLKKKHDKWASGAARDTTDKQRNRDAELEPRSTDVADLASKGIQAALTSGSADIEIASRDGAIDAHLHGEAAGGGGGGRLELGASDAHVQIAGQTVDAKGVNTGPVDISQQAGATHVQISKFSIETLHWLGS